MNKHIENESVEVTFLKAMLKANDVAFQHARAFLKHHDLNVDDAAVVKMGMIFVDQIHHVTRFSKEMHEKEVIDSADQLQRVCQLLEAQTEQLNREAMP